MKNRIIYEHCKKCGHRKGEHSAGVLLCLIKKDRWAPIFNDQQVFEPDMKKPTTIPFTI